MRLKYFVLLVAFGAIALFAQQVPHGVNLSWSWTGTGTPSYNVYRATLSGGEAKPALASGLATPAYTDTTALVNTKYFYTVTATVGGVESGPSPEVAAQITVPNAPTNPETSFY